LVVEAVTDGRPQELRPQLADQVAVVMVEQVVLLD
jgi:hypothetical protein